MSVRGEAANVLPIIVGIRDSAVQLVSTLGSVVISACECVWGCDAQRFRLTVSACSCQWAAADAPCTRATERNPPRRDTVYQVREENIGDAMQGGWEAAVLLVWDGSKTALAGSYPALARRKLGDSGPVQAI
jgi:hypothetical protein